MGAMRYEPFCVACGLVMTPANAKIRPELFLHDACLPEVLKPKPEETPAMPCPTCSATLANMGLGEDGRKLFHCGRCGTAVLRFDNGPDHVTVPSLVRSCRSVQIELWPSCSVPATFFKALLREHGVIDAINTPGERPT